MKILHLSDTHIGRSAKPRPGWSVEEIHLWAWDQAVAPALQGRVDLVLHTGDVFDRSRPPARAMAALAERLRALAAQVPVVLLGGNHDRARLHRSLPMGVPGLHVVRGAQQLRVAGLRLACVNYLRCAEAWGRAAAQAWGGGADFVLAHQAFDGAQVPGFTFRAGRQRDTVGAAQLPAGAQWVLCGHIHPRQCVALGGAQVVHPGSTAVTSGAEQGQTKGTVLWSLEREITWSYQDLPPLPPAGPPTLRVVQSPKQLAWV